MNNPFNFPSVMSPEERRRAATKDAIERGIKNKVVSGRR